MSRLVATDTQDAVVLYGTTITGRARPLAHQPTTAQLTLYGRHESPSPADLTRWLATLADEGYRMVRTGGLNAPTAAVFHGLGFRTCQELVLLEASSPSWRHGPRRRTTPLRVADLPAAAVVDTAAFGVGWGLDEAAVADVCTATPRYRARAVRVGDELVGLAISGADRDLGFIQRLAVHPMHRRHGHAATLVADAMRWFGRLRCGRVLVNTATDNTAALALYRAHGFLPLPDRLVVAERAL